VCIEMLANCSIVQLCGPKFILGMTLNCIHIFIIAGSFLYCCVMRPASQRFFILTCIYLRILIIPYLATFLGTNSLSVLMCRKAVNQSINQLWTKVKLVLFGWQCKTPSCDWLRAFTIKKRHPPCFAKIETLYKLCIGTSKNCNFLMF